MTIGDGPDQGYSHRLEIFQHVKEVRAKEVAAKAIMANVRVDTEDK